LLCPTRAAVDNLAREGMVKGVHHVGDVMYDASLFAAELAAERSQVLQTLELHPGDYAVATVHRAENTDDAQALAQILDWLRAQAAIQPIVLPLHPRTAQAAARHGLSLAGLDIREPLGYLDMTQLVANSVAVYTDSGGLQKEAYFHKVPCVTLRSETEWVETIANGWNRLWTQDAYAPRREIDEYGSGDAAKRIVALLEERYSA
jgi:UDP-GlcNAc3NAcA epimerase